MKSLMKLAPKTVTVVKEDVEEVIEVSKLVVGDIFIVRPGEQIGAVGLVVDGNYTVDESALTGESIPVQKTKDSQHPTGLF